MRSLISGEIVNSAAMSACRNKFVTVTVSTQLIICRSHLRRWMWWADIRLLLSSGSLPPSSARRDRHSKRLQGCHRRACLVQEVFQEYYRLLPEKPPLKFAQPGAERQDSVYNGFQV